MTFDSVGFVGGGRVARIILGGLRKAGVMPAEVVVSDANAAALEKLKAAFPNVRVTVDNSQPMKAGVVFVALHPPVLADTIRPLATHLRPEAVLISLAPKVTIAKLKETLGGFGRVVRSIPNAASVVNAGFNPVALSADLAGAERDGLLGWLGKLGDCPVVPEEQLESYAVLTAMGPTYLWFQFDEMRKLGESFGLTPDAAGTGLARMVAGAAKTFFESGLTAEEVMDLVPVKPLQEEEAGIRSAYRTRLEGMYRKLKG